MLCLRRATAPTAQALVDTLGTLIRRLLQGSSHSQIEICAEVRRPWIGDGFGWLGGRKVSEQAAGRAGALRQRAQSNSGA